MAMLAEPRQRKRYNLVPRGKALYEDDSRYGTKMLEKMGWEKGKGLGANEDGTKDFVRIRYKNDALGLGFEHRDDQWTQHEQSFNGLLKSLNNEEDDANTNMLEENGNGSQDDMPRIGFGFQDPSAKQEKKPKVEKLKEKISGISLEERSKQSRARVHYKKFTKGKDLAQYSEKDLANIFGKKVADEQQAANDFYQQLNNTFVKKEETKDEEEEPNKGVQIINTGVSVSDYFKTKMEALKNRNNGFDGADKNVTHNDEQMEEDVSKKKKKKKKDKKDQDMEEEKSNETKKEEPNGLIINHDVSVADYFKMKMDAIKNKKKELNNTEYNVDKTSVNDEVQEVEVIKKKKKNKKVLNVEENDSVNKEDNGHENCINDETKKEAEVSFKKEKKSKKSNAVDTVELSLDEETKSKKKDKTKKRTQEIGGQNEDIELPLIKKIKYDNSPAENTKEVNIEIDLTQEPTKKKQKKSKTKESNEVIEIDDSDKETNPVSLNEGNLMEKKKKKKSKKTKELTENSDKEVNSTSSYQTENTTGHPSEKPSKSKRKDKNSAI
ncbi:PIN2/TERF1-interacting telomerase inhibitor 1 isoform X2 [Calliphora vicina]|uniref:PIN2/TERF1-interacting telomerase inhibitor 1 isoform X2 n=1 Tax=Calliphora vicina TaxID=7373 RepID=UPI00325B9A22